MNNPCSEAPSAISTKSTSISRSNIATNSSVGINNDISADGIRIYAVNGHIVAEGVEDEQVAVYDMTGRIVRCCGVGSVDNDDLPAGVYMVRIGTHPARKVVVIR